METSSFLKALEDARPTSVVELDFTLEDGKPAAVECRDLSPKDWWRIPDNRGLPVIVGKLANVEDWSDDDKLKYWDYLRWVCRLAIKKIRDVKPNGSGGFLETWTPVKFVDDTNGAATSGGELLLSIDQFDVYDNVARVGQQVLFRIELRRADAGSGRGRVHDDKPDSVRKARKKRRDPAA